MVRERFERDGKAAEFERLLVYAVRDGLLWECWVWDQDQAAVDLYLAWGAPTPPLVSLSVPVSSWRQRLQQRRRARSIPWSSAVRRGRSRRARHRWARADRPARWRRPIRASGTAGNRSRRRARWKTPRSRNSTATISNDNPTTAPRQPRSIAINAPKPTIPITPFLTSRLTGEGPGASSADRQ